MRPAFELAQVIQRFGKEFEKQHSPNAYVKRTLGALIKCRTSALGGHVDKCDTCGVFGTRPCEEIKNLGFLLLSVNSNYTCLPNGRNCQLRFNGYDCKCRLLLLFIIASRQWQLKTAG